MKFPYRLSAALVGAAATITVVQHQIVVAKTAERIRSIAEKITVRIDGPGSAGNNGSGVIIEREKDTYTVITAAHVVNAPGRYTISTSDRKRYTIYSSQIRRLLGVDLATLQFTSDEKYRVARKGDSDEMEGGMTIYASGWYNPGPVVTERIFDTANGRIVSHFQPNNGYALAYRLDVTQPGMSGGPVLDSDGKLIAINGLAERDLRTGNVELITGIPINTFVKWQEAFAPADEPSESNPCDIARAITVKVIARGSWWSGILVQRQKRTYRVLTNDYVPISNSYQIQTPDGEIHRAERLVEFDRSNISGDDLAVLQFRSREDYKHAILAPIASLREEQKVLAAGFPVSMTPYPYNGATGLVCLWPGGKISQILDRPMQEGYQIGYFIDTVRGMNGGPLLNERGEVIGVNGKHNALRIFSNPDNYRYKDGTRVAKPLNLMTRSSWAIPIETFVQHALSSVYSER